jgi:hypothetical protein
MLRRPQRWWWPKRAHGPWLLGRKEGYRAAPLPVGRKSLVLPQPPPGGGREFGLGPSSHTRRLLPSLRQCLRHSLRCYGAAVSADDAFMRRGRLWRHGRHAWRRPAPEQQLQRAPQCCRERRQHARPACGRLPATLLGPGRCAGGARGCPRRNRGRVAAFRPCTRACACSGAACAAHAACGRPRPHVCPAPRRHTMRPAWQRMGAQGRMDTAA